MTTWLFQAVTTGSDDTRRQGHGHLIGMLYTPAGDYTSESFCFSVYY